MPAPFEQCLCHLSEWRREESWRGWTFVFALSYVLLQSSFPLDDLRSRRSRPLFQVGPRRSVRSLISKYVSLDTSRFKCALAASWTFKSSLAVRDARAIFRNGVEKNLGEVGPLFLPYLGHTFTFDSGVRRSRPSKRMAGWHALKGRGFAAGSATPFQGVPHDSILWAVSASLTAFGPPYFASPLLPLHTNGVTPGMATG